MLNKTNLKKLGVFSSDFSILVHKVAFRYFVYKEDDYSTGA